MSDKQEWNWTHTRQELATLIDRLTLAQASQIVRALCSVEDESHLAAVLSSLIRGHVARNDAEQKRGHHAR
jgi:hypothetical protein